MGKFLKYSVGYVKNLPELLLCPKDIYATRLSPIIVWLWWDIRDKYFVGPTLLLSLWLANIKQHKTAFSLLMPAVIVRERNSQRSESPLWG